LYALVSSVDQKNDLERQLERLKDYAAAYGYYVTRMVSEIGSGLNGGCSKFLKLLTDSTIGVVVVEHRDSRTRFGFPYIEQLNGFVLGWNWDENKQEIVYTKEQMSPEDLCSFFGRRAGRVMLEALKWKYWKGLAFVRPCR